MNNDLKSFKTYHTFYAKSIAPFHNIKSLTIFLNKRPWFKITGDFQYYLKMTFLKIDQF